MTHQNFHPNAAYMDAKLWDFGFKNARSLGNPQELDFLRGLHDLANLSALRDWLQTNSGIDVRITSIWQDKYGNVVPNPLAPGQQYKYQELADLAVIVRDAGNSNESDWMWLLQAKVVDDSFGKLPAGPSTAREIYLYESMPDFTWHGKQSLRQTYSLKNDFKGSSEKYKHWSFLCFKESTAHTSSNKFINVRWPGSPSKNLTVTSFCSELLKLVTHFRVRPLTNDVYGAPLAEHTEWNKLYQQILHKNSLKPQSGHASKIKGGKASVLICAMLAEDKPRTTMWVNSSGEHCQSGCNICFPNVLAEDIIYSLVSTGFAMHQPNFIKSQAIQENWVPSEDEIENRKNDGGRKPPMGGDQRDGEEGGAGVMLTLFVDVASKDAEQLSC